MELLHQDAMHHSCKNCNPFFSINIPAKNPAGKLHSHGVSTMISLISRRPSSTALNGMKDVSSKNNVSCVFPPPPSPSVNCRISVRKTVLTDPSQSTMA